MKIFMTGGTGYIGKRVIEKLVKGNNCQVKALVRWQSIHKASPLCEIVTGDALDTATYAPAVQDCDVFIHLVGVAHPSPSRKEAFKLIDLVSLQQAVDVARQANIKHFIYISVAQYPTRIMRDYQQVRAEAETHLINSGIPATILRPWYVIGPGHWWPLLLKPFFMVAKMIPSLKEAAARLDTVTIQQMVSALVKSALTTPKQNITFVEVADLKKAMR